MERIQNLLVRLLVEKKAQVVQMYNHQLTPQLSYSFCFYITLEEIFFLEILFFFKKMFCAKIYFIV